MQHLSMLLCCHEGQANEPIIRLKQINLQNSDKVNSLTIIAVTVVTLALVSYSIAILTEQKRRLVTGPVLVFLTLGVLLDISSTTMMIIVSTKSAFTLHGIMGYSALLLMLIDAFLLWRHRFISGRETPVRKRIHLYSRIAYIFWVAAYLTGSMIVLMR